MNEKELATKIETLELAIKEIKQVLIATSKRLDVIEKMFNPVYSPTSVRAKAAEAFDNLSDW